MTQNNKEMKSAALPMNNWRLSGLLMTPVRWVLGWLFFSAFWRRVVLVPGKLDPTSTSYNGNKFNNFMPHALLWVKLMLKYLLVHPSLLYAFLVFFTIVEGIVGLALLLGLATRLSGIVVTLLSGGILMGAGWLGSTCLDEWQIGVFCVAAGISVFLIGSGPWSLDAWWQKRWPNLAQRPFLHWISSGDLNLAEPTLTKLAGVLGILAVVLTLYTNQAFYGGVWGQMHNDSKKPHLTLSEPLLSADGALTFTVMRDGGPDTYGAFVVDIAIKDTSGKLVENFGVPQLVKLKASSIKNVYPLKVHSVKSALMVPLGAQAKLRLKPQGNLNLPVGNYKVTVSDVSGASWSVPVSVK